MDSNENKINECTTVDKLWDLCNELDLNTDYVIEYGFSDVYDVLTQVFADDVLEFKLEPAVLLEMLNNETKEQVAENMKRAMLEEY